MMKYGEKIYKLSKLMSSAQLSLL